jgi:hypothetical protein
LLGGTLKYVNELFIRVVGGHLIFCVDNVGAMYTIMLTSSWPNVRDLAEKAFQRFPEIEGL